MHTRDNLQFPSPSGNSGGLRIFISYARVDKVLCKQIAAELDIHDVWYDQRMFVGNDWWQQIIERLDWCQVFIYLLSPESVESYACQREYELAQKLGKNILPVLINPDTHVPPELNIIHYADFSRGIDKPEAMPQVLRALYVIERQMRGRPAQSLPVDDKEFDLFRGEELTIEPRTAMTYIAEYLDNEKYGDALFIIDQVLPKLPDDGFIPRDQLRARALKGVQMQERRSESYNNILELVKRQRTIDIGCDAFRKFRETHPNYDPHNIAHICDQRSRFVSDEIISFRDKFAPENAATDNGHHRPSPMGGQRGTPATPRETQEARVLSPREKFLQVMDIHWVPISGDGIVDDFEMAVYPVVNRQFEVFLRDKYGYRNPRWWEWSRYARAWRQKNGPRAPAFKGDRRPRENVTYYEAVAFALWLGARLGERITLPTQAQWRRAAMGDEGYAYPWGNTFHPELCNSRESRIHATTKVSRYPRGASPFGVMDMSGNIWEWCLDTGQYQRDIANPEADLPRAVLGGSFNTRYDKCQATYDFYIVPDYYYSTIGFRVVRLRK